MKTCPKCKTEYEGGHACSTVTLSKCTECAGSGFMTVHGALKRRCDRCEGIGYIAKFSNKIFYINENMNEGPDHV